MVELFAPNNVFPTGLGFQLIGCSYENSFDLKGYLKAIAASLVKY